MPAPLAKPAMTIAAGSRYQYVMSTMRSVHGSWFMGFGFASDYHNRSVGAYGGHLSQR